MSKVINMNLSPLRYPGGKARIVPMIDEIIKCLSPEITTYYEPFCGGAGVAMHLLMNGSVEKIALNDFDRSIYSFWRSVFLDTGKLICMIEKTPITIKEWNKQKTIYQNASKYSVDYAFATLFLNRTNRSGIITAGPIGGYEQKGIWKINARFNKTEIIDRIINISKYKKYVYINNMDIRRYLNKKILGKGDFIFFDSPYVNNGKRLYKNALTYKDHFEIAKIIKNINKVKWIITYDDTELVRSLYSNYYISQFSIQYSAATKKKEKELLIYKDPTMYESIQRFVVS